MIFIFTNVWVLINLVMFLVGEREYVVFGDFYVMHVWSYNFRVSVSLQYMSL